MLRERSRTVDAVTLEVKNNRTEHSSYAVV